MNSQSNSTSQPTAELTAFPVTDQAVLKAIRCPSGGRGVIRAMETAVEALDVYANAVELDRVNEWRDVAVALLAKLEAVQAINPALGMVNTDAKYPVFSLLASTPVSWLNTTDANKCRVILGKLIVSAISRDDALKVTAINAWATLWRGRKSTDAKTDWSDFLAANPKSDSELNEVQKRGTSTTLRELIDELLLANATPVKATVISGGTSAKQAAHLNFSDSGLQSPAQMAPAPSNVDSTINPDDLEDPTDSESDDERNFANVEIDDDSESEKHFKNSIVGLKIKNANFARLTQRFGHIGDKDRLHPETVKLICEKLRNDFQSGDEQTRCWVTLAYMCLKLSLPAAKTLKIPLSDSSYPYICVERKQVVWNYRYCVDSSDSADTLLPRSDVEMLHVVLDETLGTYLQQLNATNSAAKSLGELLKVPADAAARVLWLRNYRAYLRSCGDTVHPAYDARFAYSGGDIYRSECKQEIMAVFRAMDFGACPMGMLHYVTLPAADLIEADRKWEEFLGFTPAEATADTEVKGAIIHLTRPDAVQGWESAQLEIQSQRLVMEQSSSVREIVEAFNKIAPARLSCFVFLTAHRGSKLARLTARALFVHADLLHVYDKDVGSYQSDRVIPCHSLVDAVLGAWQSDIELLCRRMDELGVGVQTSGRAPFFHIVGAQCFFQVRLVATDGLKTLERKVLGPKQVGAFTAVHFNKPLNIGRHFLVSQLLSQGADINLVKALTGHSRHSTEVFSDAMGVSPKYLLKSLGDEITSLFDGLGLCPVAGATGKARKLYSLTGALPKHTGDAYLHPKLDKSWRVLPRPFDSYTLTAVQMVEQLRRAMMDVTVAGDLQADLLVSLAVFDGLTLADQKIIFENFPDSVSNAGKVTTWLWQREGCSNEIIPPVNPRALLPLNAIGPSKSLNYSSAKQLAATWLKELFPGFLWQGDDEQIYSTFMCMVARWQRYRFSPRALTAFSEVVPTTTPSRNSLLRIATHDNQTYEALPLPRAIRMGPKKSHIALTAGFDALRKALLPFASIQAREGEELQRARDFQVKLDGIATDGDKRLECARRVLQEEATLRSANSNKADQFSTLYNYFTELSCALQLLCHNEDPAMLSEAEFSEWIEDAKRSIDRANPDKKSVRLNESRFHGLKRLIVIGRRLGWEIPGGLFEDEGKQDIFNADRKSAASTLFTSADRSAIKKQIDARFADNQAMRERARLANAFDDGAPLRHSERSTLRNNCIVAMTNQLSIHTDGFSHLKSRHAVRLIPVSAELTKELEAAATKPTDHPSRYAFLSDDAEDWSQIRIIDECLVSAMVFVTGEPSVRQHSRRAGVICNRIDPSWDVMAVALYKNDWTCAEHEEAVRKLFDRGVPHFINATREAGHGHPLTTSVYYYSVWVFHYCSELLASMKDLTPTPRLLSDMLGNTSNLRKIKETLKKEKKSYDIWKAVMRHTTPRDCFLALKPVGPTAAFAEVAQETYTQSTQERAILLMTLLLLGAQADDYAGLLGFTDSEAASYNKVLPQGNAREDLMRRRRGEAPPEGLLRDRRYATSQLGLLVAASVASAKVGDLEALASDLDTNRLAVKYLRLSLDQMEQRLKSHLNILPSQLKLFVRCSSKHPLEFLPSIFESFSGRLKFGDSNPRLGPHPLFQIAPVKEEVSSEEKGRATAVVRAFVIAAIFYHRFFKGE